jgi:pterin-4a-carbinolamine dehydratase
MSTPSPVKQGEATHDAGGVTTLDVTLAHAMEELAGRQLGK